MSEDDDIQALYEFVESPETSQPTPISTGQPPSGTPSEASDLEAMYAMAEPELKQEKYGTITEQVKTFAQGTGKALTFGASVGLQRLMGDTPEDIRNRGEVNPGLEIGGELFGLGLSTAIPGVGAANVMSKVGAAGARALVGTGTSVAARITSQAANQAFQGMMYQAGAEVGNAFAQDKVGFGENAIANIGLAGIIGGVFGGALGAAEVGFAKAAVEAGPLLRNFQEERAAKALGFTKGQVKKLKGGQDEAKDVARTLMDAEIDSGERIFTPFAGGEELASRVETLRQAAGKRMGGVYQKLDDAAVPGVSPLELAAKIDGELGNFWRSPINKGEANQLENVLESVLLRGDAPIPFQQAQLLKEEIKKVAYPNGKNPIEPTPRIQIAQDAYRIINGEIDRAVDRAAKDLGEGSLLRELSLAKKEYGAAKKAGRALADRVSSEQGNKIFGLTDTIAGTVLGSGVGFGPAAGAIVLKKLAEKYGNSIVASSGDAYAQSMGKFAAAFGVGSETKNAAKLAKAMTDGYNTTKKAVNDIFDKTAKLPDNVISIAAKRDSLAQAVDNATKDPSRLYGINDNNPVEDLNQSFAEVSARAVNYLASLKPNTDPKSPLDGKRVASTEAVAKYNRALSLAQEPALIISSIRMGQVTSQDIITIRTIYPGYYKQVSQMLTNQMIETVNKGEAIPYKTRIGLSMFLGQPLDSSLTPQGILSAQPRPAEDQSAQAQGGTGVAAKPPSASSMKPLSKAASAYRTPSQASEMRGKESAK